MISGDVITTVAYLAVLLPCGHVVTLVRACLADVIANVVADVIATFM